MHRTIPTFVCVFCAFQWHHKGDTIRFVHIWRCDFMRHMWTSHRSCCGSLTQSICRNSLRSARWKTFVFLKSGISIFVLYDYNCLIKSKVDLWWNLWCPRFDSSSSGFEVVSFSLWVSLLNDITCSFLSCFQPNNIQVKWLAKSTHLLLYVS